MSLRLVHPASAGPVPRPPRGRRAPALSLTDEEVRHLRVATRNAARAYGGAEVLAQVVGVPRRTIYGVTAKKGARPSAAFALRVARAAGMHVEAILSGQLTEAGRCKACGVRLGEGRAAS